MRLLSIALLGFSLASAAAQAQATAPSTEPRITREEMQRYMDDSGLLKASMERLLANLEKGRATLPPWFPDSVWKDCMSQVAHLDLVALLLPLYQKYFSEKDGVALDLLFAGPAGHVYAQAELDSRLAAMSSGLEGSAAEAAAMSSDKQKEADKLRNVRLAELTPAELASVRAVGEKQRLTTADGLRLDDEQNLAIQAKCKDRLNTTVKAHHEEMAAAQRAYMAKHPGK
jgi:hypothetical protein